MAPKKLIHNALVFVALAACLAFAPSTRERTRAQTQIALRTLIVGGGPDKEHNQVAIESNVRYVDRLIPADSPRRILFTNGDAASKNVLYLDGKDNEEYRKPNLPRLDGPAQLAQVHSELAHLASDSAAHPQTPVLLYFTGHGSPDQESSFNDNAFDLWNGGTLKVSDFASYIDKFPKQTPITLVMVECFSGAFGNLLFKNGDPANALADHPIAGFFASAPTREAAGCTPEINEANYRDFTGYFFAALTGTDRMGKPVTGADYNHDGKVGMNEAYAYALLHDDSIDTPVCTSDVFLRKFVTTADPKIFEEKYSRVRDWATQSQLAALDGLSNAIGARGEDRLGKAYQDFRDAMNTNPNTDNLDDVRLIRFVRLAKSIILAHTLEATASPEIKARFHELLERESSNPVHS